MDPIHCQRIDSLIVVFMHQIDLLMLWPYLFHTEIFDRNDSDIPKWAQNLRSIETTKDIILKTKTRGPKAYEKLILSLQLSDHGVLADVLKYMQ